MAYTYVSALVRVSRLDATWSPVDLSAVALNQIFASYADVYLTLTNPIDGTVYLPGEVLRSIMPMQLPSPTVSAWLASVGNGALPTVTTLPKTTLVPVQYTDARQGAYKVDLTDRLKAIDYSGPYTTKPDLLVTKDSLDFASMSDYMLTSVNGYMHLSYGSEDGLYIVDGGKTSLIANDNHVGVFSFLPVGKIQQIPITLDMLYQPVTGGQYSKIAYVKLPVSAAGKIPLLSLGGYLHVLDGMYQKVGDKAIKINTARLPFPQRLYQSLKAIDLSSLPIASGQGDNAQWSVASLASDEVMKAYLTLSQSFIVLIDVQDFYRQTHVLETTGVPGIYFSGLMRRFPLMGPDGRLYDYRITNEEGVYVYGCDPVQRSNFLFNTTDWQNQLSIVGSRESYHPWVRGEGRLLEFGTFK